MQWKSTATSLALVAGVAFSPEVLAKNILIVVVDDLAVDKSSAYAADYPGYVPAFLPDMPAVQGLADAGIRFTRAWATPYCSPTRVSLQTGVHPFRHQVGTALNDSGPEAAGVDPDAFTMLAESFASAGFETGMFGKWHLGLEDAAGNITIPATDFVDAPHPARCGWDRFYGILGGYPGAGRSFTNWHRVGWTMNDEGFAGDETLHLTARTSREATAWINGRQGPWLAVVAFSAPHSPDTGSESWTYGDEAGATWRSSIPCLATQSCTNEAAAVYKALAEHVDLELEDLLFGIDAGKMEDTLIFFIGDNGTPTNVQESLFKQAGAGKGTTHENGVRVPMIVADGATWLTGAAGAISNPHRVVTTAVNTMDIFPTAHEAAGLPAVPGLDAKSYVDCFGSTNAVCGRPYGQYGYTETFHTSATGLVSAKIGVRYGTDKMVAEYCPALGCMKETFYDTATDVFELVPQKWVGVRADRLRNHFTTLHKGITTSWARSGAGVLPYCGKPCP